MNGASALTREVNTVLEPLFTAAIVASEVVDGFAVLGFDREDWWERYFAFRSAPLGRASADAVVATYFNFRPERIAEYVPRVWDIAEPAAVVDALRDTTAAMMTRALGELRNGDEVRELAALLGEAAGAAFQHPSGRPLFAGIASIPWPAECPAQLWLGMHALREFRGDGHVAVLTSDGLSGIESLVLQIAYRRFPPDLLRLSRGWSLDRWDDAVSDLRGRGLLVADQLVLSEEGARYREELEARTDRVAWPAFAPIGAEGVRRILELAPPIVAAVVAAAGRLTLRQVVHGIAEPG
jgi:hypothetical protein